MPYNFSSSNLAVEIIKYEILPTILSCSTINNKISPIRIYNPLNKISVVPREIAVPKSGGTFRSSCLCLYIGC